MGEATFVSVLDEIGEDSMYAMILDQLAEGAYFVDCERRICMWNKAAEQMTGFSAAEVVGSHCADNILMHVDECGTSYCCDSRCPLAKSIADGESRETSLFLHHKDGHRVRVSIRAAPLRDRHGKIIGGIETFTDATAHQIDLEKLKKLEQMAYLDELTGLANRRFLQTSLESRLAEMERYVWHFGVMFLDVDHFKRFNDTYGHEVGDEVLKIVSKTLSGTCRAFDVAGRWGGEEFLVIAANTTGEELAKLADRHRCLIETSCLIRDEQKLNVTVSIGATTVRRGDSVDAIVARADDLLYQSKEQGRNRVTFGE